MDRRVVSLLEAPGIEEEREANLVSACALLRQAEDLGAAMPEAASPENFLRCSEVALALDTSKPELIEIARSSVEHFLHTRPPRNQFLSRAYFALGSVQAYEASKAQAKGDELATALLTAAGVVQQGIALATELGPTHRFLVYNGSVHVYRIVRPLLTWMYAGDTADKLAAILDAVLKQLVTAEEPDADWRLQLSMQLARCIERAGKSKEAGLYLGTCGALSEKSVAPLQEQLVQLQAHMVLEDAAALKKLRDDANGVPRRRALVLTQLLVDGGPPAADAKSAAPDVAVEVSEAVSALDPDLGEALAAEGGPEAVRKAVLLVPLNTCADDDVLMALASEAARHGLLTSHATETRHALLTIASHCAQRCASSPKLACRVRSSYVKAVCKVGVLDTGDEAPQGDVYTRKMVSTRIESLAMLEEALTSARRVGEPDLIQDGCVIIWNVAMPLLQPSLVSHAERTLYLAASALEAIGSPLAQLRASLHLELARLDASREFVQKAATHVAKAQALNVPMDAGTGATANPILRPLQSLGQRLVLKTDVYRVAETPEEKAIMLLEQARTDRRVPLKRQLLMQAFEQLEASEPRSHAAAPADADADGAAVPAPAETDEEAAAALPLRRERAALWCELMKASWVLRMVPTAREAARAVLQPTWSKETDEELLCAQSDAQFTLGEAAIAELQEAQEKAAAEVAAQAAALAAAEAGGPGVRGLPPIAPPGQAEAQAAAREALRQDALAFFCKGIEVGLTLADDLVVQNGCIYLLNYNRALIRASEYAPLLTSLRVAVGALQKCDQAAMKRDMQQLRIACATASALVHALEQEATCAPAEGTSGPRTHDPKEPEKAAALKEGLEVCAWLGELCAGLPTLKRSVTACWARLLFYGGAKLEAEKDGTVKEPSVGPEPEAGAMGLLELLASGLIDANAHGAGALGRASQLLKSDDTPKPEPELWVRVAQQALALGDMASVVRACEAALRPLVAKREAEAADKASGGQGGRAGGGAAAGSGMILKEEWRWYSLAEVVHAEAINELHEERQPVTLQQQLHSNALNHLASAMVYANHAAETSLLLSAAERFWRHVSPFVEVSPPDYRLRDPVGTALAELEKLDTTLQPKVTELRVRLYEVLLRVLAHAQAWTEGLQLLQSAFASLPDSAVEPLWEEKVSFMCKGGGKGLAGEMHKLKDFEPPVQAAVWKKMGEMARTKGEQLTGMLRAVECLHASPLLKVRYLISLAQWLYTKDFPLRDAEDQLAAAVDILMDYEDVPDDGGDDDDALSSCGSTAMSATTANRAGSVSRGGASSVAGSAAGGSSAGGSNAGRGGSSAADSSLTVTQYEQLGRIHLMRAMMASSLAARLECALVGLYYLGRIWNVSIDTVNATAADKDPASATAPYTVPSEPHEWAGWQPAEGFVEAMGSMSKSERVLSSAGIPEPQLTAAYLQYAIEMLLDYGMTLHALMPLALLRHIATHILKADALTRATTLRTAHVLHQIGHLDQAAALRACVGPLRPPIELKRKNAIILSQLTQSDRAIVAAATGAPAGAPAAAEPPPPAALKRKSVVRPMEAEWVELAALLIEEGEWAAAHEWLLEASPLLRARGEDEHLGNCTRLLARLASLFGDAVGAVATQAQGLAICPLELGPWASAVLDLATYRAASGGQPLALATLAAAVDLANDVAVEHPSCSADARWAQARLQLALGKAYAAAARSLGSSAEAADEIASATAAVDAAVTTLSELGEHRGAASAFVDRVALHDVTPVVKAAGEDANYALEAEANHLAMLADLLASARAAAERAVFLASPRTLPLSVSLPVSRELAAIKAQLADVHLRHAALNAKVAAANPPLGPVFPIVEGGDADAVAAYVAPKTVAPPPAQMEHEGRALLHAASAIALAGGGAPRARALRTSALVLYSRAAVRGWGREVWEQPTPPGPAEEGAEEGADGAEGSGGAGEGAAEAAPAGDPVEGKGVSVDAQAVEDAAAAAVALTEALDLSVAEGDLETATQAALMLARASGVADAEACLKWLSLFQTCGAHARWRAEWTAACEPAERTGLLARLTQWLPQRWASPTALPSMKSAQAALEDASSGSEAWRSLAVPADPLAELWPTLPAGMRVLLLAFDSESGDLYGGACGALVHSAEGLPKGAEPPPPELLVRVSRLCDVGARLEHLLSELETMLSLQSKAALTTSKTDIVARQAAGTAAAVAAAAADAAATSALEGGEVPSGTVRAAIVPASVASGSAAETKLRALSFALNALLEPLLAPLLPLLGADAQTGGGDALSVVVVADGALAALPLELIDALRAPHVAGVSRDLSMALLARRLARSTTEPAACKKAAFGSAVDPRDEVILPKEASTSRPPSAGKGKGKKGGKAPPQPAVAADDGATMRKLCGAFTADVLEGSRAPMGKEWPRGAALLGSEKVPSEGEWQRTMLGSGGFLYEGPGAFHESLPPARIAPLRLSSCVACLLFDRAGSDAASRRLAKEANVKSPRRIALETAHATAALLSLSGVRTVLTNQWAAAAQSNHEMLVAVLTKLGDGATVSMALAAAARAAIVSEHKLEPPADRGSLAGADSAAATVAGAAPAPAPAAVAESAKCLWTVLANPIVYGLPSFTVTA